MTAQSPSKALIAHLYSLQDPVRAKNLTRFFQTAPGQYGAGDQFIGLTVPQIRQAVKLYASALSLSEITDLLHSTYHEYRFTALLSLGKQYGKGDKKKIFELYLKNTHYINNWDLVDLSAPNIVGEYLLDKPRNILYKLSKSNSIWERRISILATFAFIRRHDFTDSLRLAEILLHDPHDLIHKAVGWMLRELGKRDLPVLISFLDKHATVMPRTMLRYAIEKLPESRRQGYLHHA